MASIVSASETPRCGSRPSVSLVLPAWNEAEAIARAVLEAEAALALVAERYEVIVVDDGSSDATSQIVAELAAERPAVRLVRHEVNRGYGAALQTGFAAATGDLVAFTDADSQFDLTELDRFVLLARSYPIVCGYRIDRQDSKLRCLYSRVYNQLVRLLLGTQVRDVDCALKMFHRDVLPKLPITTGGFLINAEMLAQARQQGIPVVEVGATHRPRTEGQSTVSIRHIPVVFAALLRFWWNRVQFPGESAAPRRIAGEAETRRERRLLWGQWAVLAAAAVLLFARLDYPLIERDEARYGEIPREMVESGNWVLPQLNYEPYYDKPALLYWLCAISYELFGVSSWSARLVAPLAGAGTVAATMWFGSRMFGRMTGLLGGVILLASAGFLGASRFLLIDGVLATLTTVAMFAAFEAVRDARLRWGWWLAASAATGLAFMAKGPIAVVLLAPPVAAFAWLTQDAVRLRLRHWAIMGAVVAAIAAPWFVAVTRQAPEFLYEFFYRHNMQRFAGAYHTQPAWYFVPVLMLAGHPWTFLTAPILTYLATRQGTVRSLRTPALGFLALWAGWCFAFFSASKCKLPSYILPAAPAFALMAAHYFQHGVFTTRQAPWREYARRMAPWLSTAATCVGGIGVAVFAVIAGAELPLAAGLTMAFWAVLLAAALAASRQGFEPGAAWGMCLATTVVFGSQIIHRTMPRYAMARTVFGEGSPLMTQHPLDSTAIATFDHEWSHIAFELQRNDIHNFVVAEAPQFREFAQREGRVMIVMRKRQDLDVLRAQLPPQTKLDTVAVRGSARILVATVPEYERQVARRRADDRSRQTR
ncbi:MAG: glycosyltransferase [Pirellulales bacterium]|nr:glycosyltransferase [Pirellulales bacterium]